MPTYRVHYAKSPHAMLAPHAVAPDTLKDTHALVATIDAPDGPDDAFRRMQGELMPPEEAKRIGPITGHTSMSIGDALEQEDGTLLVCDRQGWLEYLPQDRQGAY